MTSPATVGELIEQITAGLTVNPLDVIAEPFGLTGREWQDLHDHLAAAEGIAAHAASRELQTRRPALAERLAVADYDVEAARAELAAARVAYDWQQADINALQAELDSIDVQKCSTARERARARADRAGIEQEIAALRPELGPLSQPVTVAQAKVSEAERWRNVARDTLAALDSAIASPLSSDTKAGAYWHSMTGQGTPAKPGGKLIELRPGVFVNQETGTVLAGAPGWDGGGLNQANARAAASQDAQLQRHAERAWIAEHGYSPPVPAIPGLAADTPAGGAA